MTEFKKGDRVRIITSANRFWVGKVGTFNFENNGYYYIGVGEVFDRMFWTQTTRIELVEKTYEVIVPEQPAGVTKVKDKDGDICALQESGHWVVEIAGFSPVFPWEDLVKFYGPLTEVHEPKYNVMNTNSVGESKRIAVDGENLSYEGAKQYLRDRLHYWWGKAERIDFNHNNHLNIFVEDNNSYHWTIEEVK